jgi:restriction system protein
MAEITRKRTGELLRKLFEILQQTPEGMPAADAIKALANAVKLSDYEAGFYSGGVQRFDKIVRFATVDCVKAGWLKKEKGIWTLTPAGLQAWQSIKDPEAFYKEAVKLYHKWKSTQEDGPNTEDPGGAGVNEAEGAATITYEKAEEEAWSQIVRFLGNMPPFEFQDLIGGLLEAMGYHVSWISPPGKDGGVDIIAYSDPLGTQAPRIKVQAKRIQQKADQNTLKAFLANVSHGDVGIFVATNGFTKDAEDYARSQESRKITLIDAKRLVDLWVEFFKSLKPENQQRLPLRPIYFLVPQT